MVNKLILKVAQANYIPGFTQYKLIYEKDHKPLTAIVILNQDLEVMQISQYTTRWVSVCQVNYFERSLIVVSIYFKWDGNIEEDLRNLQDILSTYRGTPILVVGDPN